MSGQPPAAAAGQAGAPDAFGAWIDAQRWGLIAGREVYTVDQMAEAFAAGQQSALAALPQFSREDLENAVAGALQELIDEEGSDD